MKINKSLLNILGQVRIYSLIDLILLCFALRADRAEFVGIIALHLGFLFYLEHQHKHKYRNKIPSFIWSFLLIVGIYFYNNSAVIGFLIASYFYTKKNKSYFGALSPFMRGFQMFFLSAGIIGFVDPFSRYAGLIFFMRNFNGDLRDIEKDRKERLKTLPIMLGLRKDWKNIHFYTLLVSSAVWWSFSELNLIWLVLVYVIQYLSYNKTPR